MAKDSDLTIVKQVSARLTDFGFPNNVKKARVTTEGRLGSGVFVVKVEGLVHEQDVYALCINKGHDPQPAWHVVDFRIGNDIYT
jgi:hypothetical protein